MKSHRSVTLVEVYIGVLLMLGFGVPAATAQVGDEIVSKRGKLWDLVRNDGFIGSLGAWDFLVPYPLGMYPGFENFSHPIGGESQFYDGGGNSIYSNANFHNFRSGCWVLVKGMNVPGLPPEYKPAWLDYELYLSGIQPAPGTYGVQTTRAPLVLRENFAEKTTFNPSLPEEMIEGNWHTNTTVSVTRRSYAWSYPGYSDFIIYDYVFKNTGTMVSILTNEIVKNRDYAQTLNGVLFTLHSGISVSTKSQINFHCDYMSVAAGGFGYERPTYHDYYHQDDNGTLVYSTNFNGGRMPLYWLESHDQGYCLKDSSQWIQRFGPELQSPAAFGWLALYASPTGGSPRTTPKPDVLRIDSHKGGNFQNKDLDLQRFPRDMNDMDKKYMYEYASTPDSTGGGKLVNDGTRENFFTFTYGPYTLRPGDSVRIVVAEIAGVMDYADVIAGDPHRRFPDSTIAAIRRNAERARQAVRWGMGATVDGMPLAADVPEPPPLLRCDATNASAGLDSAIVAVTWEKTAETTTFRDGAGAMFYDGVNDLDGYRVYRSTDFQYTGEEQPQVFRGATWSLVADIPKTQFSQYWDSELKKYRWSDQKVKFGFPYAYYVAAYRLRPKAWTSANGTHVSNLPPMEGGDVYRSAPVEPAPGPTASFDVFAVPNPYVYGDAARSFGKGSFKVEFRNLPERCTIRIYSIVGDLVRTIEHKPDDRGNVFGSESWDQKSDSGLLVAPGLYLYHVESKTQGVSGTFVGKLMLVR